MDNSTHFPDTVQAWLGTPLGEALLKHESRIVEEAFDGIFGEQCLQLGRWGDPQTFLKHSRTQRKWLLDEGADAAAEPAGIAVVGNLHRLPVQDNSVDCVLLPHVLDYSDRPHAILREVDRVLTTHGHLAILGFKPGGFWGVRRLIRGAELPPGGHNLVPERRLRDWLQLLDMRIQSIQPYFFRWPLTGKRGATSERWEQRGRNWWPGFAACYMLTAQKRVSTLTPVRPIWRKEPQAVAGLAGSANRVSRIRFDPKN